MSRVPRLHLVRHAEPAARYVEHADPGLSELGVTQALALAERLAPVRGAALISSPLRRAYDTGRPVAQQWGAALAVEPRVAEIHSPSDALEERAVWLRDALGRSWSELGDAQRAWRDAVVATLTARTVDTVVFTHFVAINVAIGAANADDRVVCAPVGHASVTVLDVVTRGGASQLELVELGDEAPIEVR